MPNVMHLRQEEEDDADGEAHNDEAADRQLYHHVLLLGQAEAH